MSLYLGDTPIAVNSSSRNIGEIIQSTIPLTDAGLHLLDGSLISGSGSYADFVTYIAGLVSTYPDIFETEANWQTSVSTYGVCGKFVYDSVNNTVRLPKITGFTEGSIDPTTLGDLTQAGLPNITASKRAFYVVDNDTYATGAFTCTVQSNQLQRGGGYPAGNGTLNFDASLSNSIYGNSTTVQPQSIKVLYYVCIATATKTQIEVDIDEVMTDLNGKADVDLSNVNNSGASKGAGWAMPSGTYDNLTMGVSGATYTAPANGWFTFDGTGAGSHFQMNNQTSGLTATYPYASGVYAAHGFLPAKKNDIVQINYNSGAPSGGYFRFIYAEGEV